MVLLSWWYYIDQIALITMRVPLVFVMTWTYALDLDCMTHSACVFIYMYYLGGTHKSYYDLDLHDST